MKKRKIGIDLDDVLLGCNASLAIFHNSRYGTNYTVEDIHTWDLEHVWGCAREESVRRIYEWFDSEYHDQSEPVFGAIEGVTKLSQYYEQHIVTARPSSSRDKTQNWIDRHFPNVFSGLHFTNHFEDGAILKSEVCRELGIEFFVDDSHSNAHDIASADISSLLLDYPWNRKELKSGVVRVFNWEEIVRIITMTHGLRF